MDIETIIEGIAAEIGVDRSIVEKAVKANGFFDKSTLDAEEENLVALYAEYLEAMVDVKEQRRAFKYTDGEESIDKSNAFDQYRRYANDLFSMYTSARRAYDDARSGTQSFFKIRGRAGVLDERTRR